MPNKLTNESFLIHYKAATKVNLTREQLSDYLGIKVKSLMKRRSEIIRKHGTPLPKLTSDKKVSRSIPKEKLDIFYKIIYKQEENLKPKEENKITKNKKRYIITSAQNATPPHDDFLAALKNYLEVNEGTELLVIPYRYKNPTSVWDFNNKSHEWWHNDFSPYICDNDVQLCEHLRVLGHIKMQPTATVPLSGFDSYSDLDSAIFGHPKVQLKTVPTPSMKLPKILTTTGTATLPNYTDSKAGKKAENFHTIGAVIVETEGDEFHIRHITANSNGSFYDLDRLYTKNSVNYYGRLPALITGDSHAEFIDEKVETATYHGPNSIAEVLDPEVMIFHDVEDFYSRNHHHKGNDIISYGKHFYGRNNVEESLQISADFIDRCSREKTKNVIVRSNHDEALDRWLRESDPKYDPENARFYHYMKYHQYKNIKRTETGFDTINAFEFWCNNPDSFNGLKNKENTKFLKRGESFVVNKIELGFHGDIGPNGARGSARSFSKIGQASILGHSHCLTNNHQVLTKDGWVDIDTVDASASILTYNNGFNEYSKIENSFHGKYSGDILEFGGDILRQEVTDYHNLFLQDGTYLPITDAIVLRDIREIPISSHGFKDKNNKIYETSKEIISKVVSVCADSHIQENKWIRFHIKKDRKIERLKEIFGDDLGEISKINKNGAYKVSLKTNSKSYNEVMNCINYDKKIPEKFKNLSYDNKLHLIKELKYWDGTYKESIGGQQWSTAKYEEAQIISSIITELGFRHTFKKSNSNKSRGHDLYYLTWCDSNYFNEINKNSIKTDKQRIDNWKLRKRYVENIDVYCFKTKNNNFWVRHKSSGKISLTGNSPCVYENVYQVGLSARSDLEYAKGQPSSWMHTHCLVYPDGSRTLIHVINGNWRKVI